jgi:hypothetical protein
MAGNVYESKTQLFSAGSSQLKMGKAEINGDAAALFFFQAIGVNARERFDQRGLAMVDVSGGAEDDGFN